MLLDCQYPVFEVRKYVELREEGNYIVVQTFKTRWVLDYKYKTDEDYATRRIQLKTDRFRPYKLYPLYKMHRTPGQLVKSKHRLFIDRTGKLISYKPQKFYNLKIAKIKASWVTLTGGRAYKVLSTNRTFVSEDTNATHLAYVEIGRRTILYDLIKSEDLPEFNEVRIKL